MSLLHTIGDFSRELLGGIPLPVVRALFLALPVLLLIWVLALPREATTPAGSKRRGGDNLKIWASIALLIQIAIYSLL